jgi:hypothetical protein
MAIIHLRQDKERPLTIEEVDSNFDSLNQEVSQKLDLESFTADNVLLLLEPIQGAQSTIDARKLQSYLPSKTSQPNTVAVRDSLSNIYANQFYGVHVGAVLGNVTGNVVGTVTGNASNVDGVVQIEHGGTGGTNAASARTNLGLGNISTQNKSSIDITGGTITGITDLTLEDGGTGASNASGARSNLGLVIGSDVQAYAAILSGISATTGDGIVVRTSTNTSVVRKIVAGNSIDLTNDTGKNGDINIGLNLNPTVSSITKTASTAGSGDIGASGNRFGKAYIDALAIGDISSAPTGGEIWAKGNITAYYSDDRLKTRLGNIENALDKIDQLTGFYYEANQTAQDLGYEVRREIGLSAQDTQKILPEIVKPAPVDNKYLTIDYERFVPLLVEGIKELRNEIHSIKSHIGMGE